MIFGTNHTTALTLDSSQNATFAGSGSFTDKVIISGNSGQLVCDSDTGDPNSVWVGITYGDDTFSDCTSESLTHSGFNVQEAGSTHITNYGYSAISKYVSNTSYFSMHDGHDGSPDDYPAYIAIYLERPYAVNQYKQSVHTNGFGHFELQGSNNADTTGDFYKTGTWTSLPFSGCTGTGLDTNIQNCGGVGMGGTDRDVKVFNYNNDIAYTHYRLWIKDNSNSNESIGTRLAGWASYEWELLRV